MTQKVTEIWKIGNYTVELICHYTLTITGWTAVQRGQYIDHDIHTTPLEIWTNSTTGSGDMVDVALWASTRTSSGTVRIKLTSPPQYYVYYCKGWTNFPTDLPTTTVKVWRISVINSDNTRVKIVCNEKEVLNIVFSYSPCNVWWRNDAVMIYFGSYDTASDYYRPYQGKY